MIAQLVCLIISLSVPQIVEFVNTHQASYNKDCWVGMEPNIHATLEYDCATNSDLIFQDHILLMEEVTILGQE